MRDMDALWILSPLSGIMGQQEKVDVGHAGSVDGIEQGKKKQKRSGDAKAGNESYGAKGLSSARYQTA